MRKMNIVKSKTSPSKSDLWLTYDEDKLPVIKKWGSSGWETITGDTPGATVEDIENLKEQINLLKDMAPEDLDTLKEIADRITTIQNSIPTKTSELLNDSTYVTQSELNAIQENVNYLNEECVTYGVIIDTSASSPNLSRCGNTELHRTLPVQSLMRRCVLSNDGTINYYLDNNDSTKKEDGTDANLDGTDGQVMVVLPKHYRRLKWIDDTTYRIDISLYPFNDAIEVPEMYVSAFEATVDRENGNMLSSVMNSSARYRGGNNQSSWDGTYRDVCGKPATSISLITYRTYARKRGENWNCYEYKAHLSLYWMFVIEYATLNSQANFDSTLTEEGFKKGGLGAGVTNINDSKWSTYNSYYPFIPCGYTVSLGNNTGIVPFEFNSEQLLAYGDSFSTNVPSYRGIENPFGHIFKWTDGVLFNIQSNNDGGRSISYRTDHSKNYGDISKYTEICDVPRTSNYIEKICANTNADIIPISVQGSSSYYFCDRFYISLPDSGVSLRGLLLGGHAYSGSNAGLAYVYSIHGVSYSTAPYGSRLCFCKD